MSRSITLSVNRPMRSVLRFRRWSRKGYAAFISRKHTVTIGCLAAAVADRFYQKGLSLHRGVSLLVEALREETEHSSQHPEREDACLLFVEQALLLLLLSQEQTEACPAWVSAMNVFDKQKAGKDQSVPSRLFCV